MCLRIEPGMTVADLRLFAREYGLRSEVSDGLNYLVESRSFGRHGCRVVVGSGVVQTSDYSYAD